MGLGIDEPAWDHSRQVPGGGAEPSQGEQFSVDGAPIEAWASRKSFKPKDGGDGGDAGAPRPDGRNAEVDFKGQQRSNDTHQSTTDPEARLYRKGAGLEARLGFIGPGLMENRSGLIVDTRLTQADGHAERITALSMIEPRADRPVAATSDADKAYDAEDFVNELKSLNVRAHVAQNTSRRSAIDGRTTRHAGCPAPSRDGSTSATDHATAPPAPRSPDSALGVRFPRVRPVIGPRVNSVCAGKLTRSASRPRLSGHGVHRAHHGRPCPERWHLRRWRRAAGNLQSSPSGREARQQDAQP